MFLASIWKWQCPWGSTLAFEWLYLMLYAVAENRGDREAVEMKRPVA